MISSCFFIISLPSPYDILFYEHEYISSLSLSLDMTKIDRIVQYVGGWMGI
jgi:hypothetical protein